MNVGSALIFEIGHPLIMIFLFDFWNNSDWQLIILSFIQYLISFYQIAAILASSTSSFGSFLVDAY
jgi:hypothetical protein